MGIPIVLNEKVKIKYLEVYFDSEEIGATSIKQQYAKVAQCYAISILFGGFATFQQEKKRMEHVMVKIVIWLRHLGLSADLIRTLNSLEMEYLKKGARISKQERKNNYEIKIHERQRNRGTKKV